MSKLYNSDLIVKPFSVGLPQPVDVRTIVSNLSDLINKETFTNLEQICAGLPIAVVEQGKSGIWYLPDEATLKALQNKMLKNDEGKYTYTTETSASVTEDAVKAEGWVKLSSSDVSTLAKPIYEIVEELPVENANKSTFYLLAATFDEGNNIASYDEYLYAPKSEGSNTIDDYELVGNTNTGNGALETIYAKLDASNLDTINTAAWRSKLGVKTKEETTSEITLAVQTAVTLDNLVTNDNAASWRSKLGIKSAEDTTQEIKDATKLEVLVTDENVTSWRSKLGIKTEEEINDIVDSKIEEAISVESLVTESNVSDWRSKLGIKTLENIEDTSNGIVVAKKAFTEIYTDPETISLEDVDSCLLTFINGSNITEVIIANINGSYEIIIEIISGISFINIPIDEEKENFNFSNIKYSSDLENTIVKVEYYK